MVAKVDPLQLVAWARETIGTPYQHQQRVAGLALDCAGVPAYIGCKLGMEFADPANYGRLPDPQTMKKSLDDNLVRVPKESMQVGDLVWMTFETDPQHLGILGDYPHGGFSLIHAYNGSGLNKVVEHRLDEVWEKRIAGVWRYPGVA